MTATLTSTLGRGFSEPVLDAQNCFRALMSAMSEPGTIHRLAAAIEAPVGLSPAAAVTLLTLADHDTPIWLHEVIDSAAAGYIRFHCGASIAKVPADAQLAVLDGSVRSVPIAAFNAGQDLYPDRSATIIVQCANFTDGRKVTLTGPGIRTTRTIAPAGLHSEFWTEAQSNQARYPLGVDFMLVAGSEIVALPRSTAIAIDGGR